MHLGAVDGERCQCAHARPRVVGIGELERAAPDLLGLVELVSGPRHPALEQKAAHDRPRIAQPLRGVEGSLQQLLRFVDVAFVVDCDVAEEPQGHRQRKRVVLGLAERDRPVEHLEGGRVVAQPVAGLAQAGEDAGLSDAPAFLGSAHRECPLVAIDRGLALHAPARAIA